LADNDIILITQAKKQEAMKELPLPFLTRLDKIIETNLHDENFSIETLCRELTISYTHTYRKIRQETGLSPSMYVCRKRILKACQLLAESRLTIGDIAFQVGFNSQAYFSKCFSDTYGYPPFQYRKRLEHKVSCVV